MSQLGQPLSPLISESDELIFSVLEISVLLTLNFKDGETRVKCPFYGFNFSAPFCQNLTFITTCPLDAVQRFVTEGIGEDVADDQVHCAMRELRNVETLILDNTTHILPLLLLSDARNDARNHRLLCPRLETLAIDDDQKTPHQDIVQVVRPEGPYRGGNSVA